MLYLHHVQPYLSFFFNAPATTEIYTLSLHDALPISPGTDQPGITQPGTTQPNATSPPVIPPGSNQKDRKSTRLNSSHVKISYAVFCLKKKKKEQSTLYSAHSKH